MNRLKRLGKTLKAVGVTTAVSGFCYFVGVAGASDSPKYPVTKLFQNLFYVVLVLLLGYGLLRLAEYLIDLSDQRFVQVRIINAKGEIKTKIVRNFSRITLASDEEIYEVDRRLLHFR